MAYKKFTRAIIFFLGTFLLNFLLAAAADPTPLTINANLPGPYSVSGAHGSGPVAIIGNLYYFSLALGGMLAFGSIVYAGIKWTTSRGNVTAVGDARDRITQAVLGLLLLFGAYLIMRTINPELTVLKIQPLSPLSNTPPAAGGGADHYFACQDDNTGANVPDVGGTTTCHKNDNACGSGCPSGSTCRESPSCSASTCDPQTLAQRSNVPYRFVNAPELISLMQCIESNPNVIGAGGAPGTKFTEDINHPSCNYTRGKPVCDPQSKCSHAQNSCHYGGASGSNGSLAVDYAATGPLGYRVILGARACGVPANKARCEDNSGTNKGYDQSAQACNPGTTHVHISAPGCDRN